MKLRKNTRLLLIFSSAALAIFLAGYFLIGLIEKSFIPSQFIEARNQGGAIAKEIVAMTEESLKTLEVISLNDRQYNFRRALELVREELERAKKSRAKAIKLTEQLDLMARAAAGISPTKARNLAIGAMGEEISLISHLIVYNDALSGLLQTLEFKFSGDIRYDSEEVQNLIKNMNLEAKEINNLNEFFNQKMRELDNITK